MEAGNKSMSPNIEASDTEMIEFRKEKASLIHIHIEKCKKGGFLILWYLE